MSPFGLRQRLGLNNPMRVAEIASAQLSEVIALAFTELGASEDARWKVLTSDAFTLGLIKGCVTGWCMALRVDEKARPKALTKTLDLLGMPEQFRAPHRDSVGTEPYIRGMAEGHRLTKVELSEIEQIKDAIWERLLGRPRHNDADLISDKEVDALLTETDPDYKSRLEAIQNLQKAWAKRLAEPPSDD